jgi:outer membrane protein OmpA-like peptidoglycan-associated protein
MRFVELVTSGTITDGTIGPRKMVREVVLCEAAPRAERIRGTACRVIVLGALIGALAGCAAPEPDAALLQARGDYAAAAGDPGVASMAPDQLRQSQQALQQSEQALSSGKEMPEVDHYAFLASRYAATARQTARLKEAQQVVANAPVERSQALAAAQATRAQQAEQQAQLAQQRAQEAQQQAQAAQQQTQSAQQQAEAEHQRALQAQTDQERLQKELTTLQARQTSQGLVLSPREILFQPGRSVLEPGAEPAIRRLADFLKNNPDRNVLVEGFTDSTGNAALNQQLSEQRADAVRLALINDGVDPSRIQIRGMSDAQPLASNDSSAGRLVNRRVQIVISNQSETLPASGSTRR